MTKKNFKKSNSFFFEDIFVILLTFVAALYIFNLPLNAYLILKNDYHQRLINTYGFCEKESYGYVEKINKKFNFKKNIKTYNFKDFPSESSVFFFNPNLNFDKNLIIILNYDKYNYEIKRKLLKILKNIKF
jgi:hypothetical protein